jgi:hypothetical protein
MAVIAVVIVAILIVILIPFVIEGMAAIAVGGTSLAGAIKIFVAGLLTGFAGVANAGQGSGGKGGMLCGREAECEAQLKVDDDTCSAIAGPRYGPAGLEICQSSAIVRYGECLRFGVDGIRSPLAIHQ